MPQEPQATDAFSWGWTKFTQNAAAFILGQLAWVAVIIALSVVWVVLLAATGVFGANSSNGGAFVALTAAGIGGFALVSIMFILVAVFASAGMANATLMVADGRTVGVGDFFKVRNALQVLLVAVILAAVGALSVFTFVGPLIVQFFAVYVVLFVIDRNLGAIDAIRAGALLVWNNVGQTLILVLLAYVANAVGGALCLIGTLVSLPVTMLATVWLYRRQMNAPVAP
ncbi:MAG: hypothetical protein JJE50_06980 [Actinomycetales bacterium]|nr:hypothetical protein [Actinomycetales bacterium]